MAIVICIPPQSLSSCSPSLSSPATQLRLFEYYFFDVDKLGIVWHIHAEQVNYLDNLLPMLRCVCVRALLLPIPNKACNHIFFTFRDFLTPFMVHFSQTVHVSKDDVVAQDGR